MKSTAWEPLGRALRDYQAGREDATLIVRTDAGEPEELPAALFFRGRDALRVPEREAVALCRGRVLDVGAGAGAIALLLQEEGIPVTALDPLPDAVAVMRARGVRDARRGSLFEPPADLLAAAPWDTLLLLMNGTGIAGTPGGLGALLDAARRLLAADGQLLVDSTGPEAGEASELHYQLEYDGGRGDPFPWLLLGPDAFASVARAHGWRFEVAARGEEGEYLARLEPGRGAPAGGAGGALGTGG